MQESSIKVLNFFPFYANLIRDKKKTTTLRLGNKCSLYKAGEQMDITIGWDLKNVERLGKIVITEVILKKIKDLTTVDLVGESPDCLIPDAVKYCLGAIYRKDVNEEDIVTIVKWEFAD